ncbi:MAG: prepilin-type N-terminal cleavage/methylation domain-containing protein [Thermodesulfovibrionia bacterium]|nr:prepilin-type N-terminal cleavage/methylation domain-containing protein [Thermodesulfovibrionia bacterium]
MGIKKSWEEGTSTSSAQGFTLVELAIVLVIIGIIIGAVMKGQDLIDNARAKKVITTANTWNMLTWTYMDRKGRFPGDSGRNGIIGDTAGEVTAAASAIGEMVATGAFTNPPDNPVSIGSYTLYIYMGFDSPGATNKNVMVICNTVNCAAATTFTLDELKLIEAVDTAIDGLSDAGQGQFRGATAVTLAAAPAQINNKYAAAVTAVTGVGTESTAGTATPWGTTQNAAVWLFDRPY